MKSAPFLFIMTCAAGFAFSETTTVEFSFDDLVPFGNDLAWAVVITNGSMGPKTFEVSFAVDSLRTDGMSLGEVAAEVSTNVVHAGSSGTCSLRVPNTVYSAFSGSSETFECQASVSEVANDDVLWTERMRSYLSLDSPLVISATPTFPAPTGTHVLMEVHWTNTTPLSLEAHFSFVASEGLQTEDGRDMIDWPPLTIPPGGAANVSTSVVVTATERQEAHFFMKSDKTPLVTASLCAGDETD